MELGFVGVGAMGAPMAGRLLDGGHGLIVHDVRPEAVAPLAARQARTAESPKAVADMAETVIVSLPTLGAWREVGLGADGLAKGGRIAKVVNTCTVGSGFIREMAAALGEAGIEMLDCPISGGPPGAEAGTLSVMASGSRALFDELRPALDCWGHTVVHVGEEPGAAQTVKLVNNILSAAALAVTSEALVMGSKAGVDLEAMLEAVNAGSGRNSATAGKVPASVLDRSFAYGAALDILMKDIELALAEAERLQVPSWVSSAVRQFFRHWHMQGKGREDITSIVQMVEGFAGHTLPKVR